MEAAIEIFSTQDDELGYEWNEFHLYKNLKGEYFANSQMGCSCDSYEHPIDWNGISPMKRSQVIQDFTEWGKCLKPLNKTRELERMLKSM